MIFRSCILFCHVFHRRYHQQNTFVTDCFQQQISRKFAYLMRLSGRQNVKYNNKIRLKNLVDDFAIFCRYATNVFWHMLADLKWLQNKALSTIKNGRRARTIRHIPCMRRQRFTWIFESCKRLSCKLMGSSMTTKYFQLIMRVNMFTNNCVPTLNCLTQFLVAHASFLFGLVSPKTGKNAQVFSRKGLA